MKKCFQIIKDGWRSCDDPNGIGIENEWFKEIKNATYPAKMPGMAHDYSYRTWYEVDFIPEVTVHGRERCFLSFAGVPYYTRFWLNGEYLGENTGRNNEFDFDVTEFIREKCRLSILCINPSPERDYNGMTQANLAVSWFSAPRFQQAPVLSVKPDIFLGEIFVRSCPDSSTVSVCAEIENLTSEQECIDLTVILSKNAGSHICGKEKVSAVSTSGKITVKMAVSVSDFHMWSPDDPYLYSCSVMLSYANGDKTDIKTVRTAFRKFFVDESGYFNLNGKRLYLKMTHFGNAWPLSPDTADDLSGYRRLLIYLKSCGFNAVRQLASAPLPEILDICDELGLLFYSEHSMAWHKKDCEQTDLLFRESVETVLKRDRNHPCMLMFGFQNETLVKAKGTWTTDKLYHSVLEAPRYARDLAPDTVFFLQSARFDGNRHYGSVCNPGSFEWDGYMGNESPEAPDSVVDRHIPNYYTPEMGDVHLYPIMPYGKKVKDTLSEFNKMKRGVFLSEAGVGSLTNIFAEKLYFEQYGLIPQGKEKKILENHCHEFMQFYHDYRLDRIFAAPEDAFRASQSLQAKQRRLYFDLIRRVDRFNGYSMTMATDTNLTGEGVMGMFHDVKPEMYDVMHDGWSDLRFCITVGHTVLYRHETLELDVVLSDLGVLSEGTAYPILISISGPNGVIWSKEIIYTPEKKPDGYPPFAADLIKEEISLQRFEQGEYLISAEFLSGARAYGNKRSIYVFDRNKLPTLQKIYAVGLDKAVTELLLDQGAEVITGLPDSPVGHEVILVSCKERSDSELNALYELARAGAHLVILDPEVIIRKSGTVKEDSQETIDFSDPDVQNIRVPFEKKGSLSEFGNWLYHYEYVVHDSSVTNGLKTRCLMDPEYYEDVWSNRLFRFTCTPEYPSVSGFFAGNDTTGDDSFKHGFLLGTFVYGKGKITLNSLRITESIGRPVADMILCNLSKG